MSLEDYMSPLCWEMAVWLERFYSSELPVRELGTLSTDLTSGLRSLAIIQLLTRDDRVHFYKNLEQSAQVRLYYLKRLQAAKIYDDHHQASARYRPLLDAVAVGRWDLAQQIVSLSPTEMKIGHEYTDDFCFAQLISNIVAGESGRRLNTELLDMFETYLDGEVDSKLELARSLIELNQKKFDNAFGNFLDARTDEIEFLTCNGQMESARSSANRLVFVDGLAIIQIADKQGLNTEDEYKYCPSSGRDPYRYHTK